MECTVFIIGEKFRFMPYFTEAILRELESGGFEPFSILFLKESDPKILAELELHLQKKEQIVICAQKSAISLISKTISTHLRDTMVHKNGMLVPSTCKDISDGSYTVTINGNSITVLKVEPNKEIPKIQNRTKKRGKRAYLLDIDEDGAKALILPLLSTNDISAIIYTNSYGIVEMVLEEKKYGNMESFCQKLTKLFDKKIIISDSLQAFLIEKLSSDKMTVALAESCTGGLISSLLTSIPGSSSALIGSLVTYSNSAKSCWLGVDSELIDTKGAVSKECVSQMLDGILRVSGADFVVSISGIAGPTGATDTKPVGLVYIGVASRSGKKSIEEKIFKGDRILIQSSSACFAMQMLCKILLDI